MPWFAPVLGKLFKMGETAVITHLSVTEENEVEKMTEYRIVKNVPRTYQARAKNINRAPKRLHECQLER